MLTEQQKKEIDEQLLDRVIVNGRRLKDIYIKKQKQQESGIQESKLNLQQRISQLERRYNQLRRKHVQLEQQYSRLKQRTQETHPQTQTSLYTINSPHYSTSMRDYRTHCEREDDNLTAAITAILAGDYVGKIELLEQGNFNEDQTGKCFWTWEDRLKAVKTVIKNNQEQYQNTNQNKKQVIKQILCNHKYLRKKHEEKYQELSELLQ